MKKTIKIIILLCNICLIISQDTIFKKQLQRLSTSYIIARAIHTAVELQIPDHIKNEINTLEGLANILNANHTSLNRFLNLLCNYNIIEKKNNIFFLTHSGALLCQQNKDSLYNWILYHEADRIRWNTFAHIKEAILTGKSSFNYLYNKSYFEFLKNNPPLFDNFQKGLAQFTKEENEEIVKLYQFASHQKIIDIGGGNGDLLVEINKVYPNNDLCLYEICQPNITTNLEYIQGDFFNTIPSDKDIYILKRILHDWNNEQAINILQNCAYAMNSNSRLLIIEGIVDENEQNDFLKDIDISLLVLFGGEERTLQTWNNLFQQAHLSIEQIYNTDSYLNIIVVKKI